MPTAPPITASHVTPRRLGQPKRGLGVFLLLYSLTGWCGDEVFQRWAALHAVPLASAEHPADGSDLAPLGERIGSARVVAFGEAQHATHELLAMRNRLFRFLVERMGFSAIALESGFTESAYARPYLERGEGDARTAATIGLSAGLDAYAENIELLQWVRDYNAAARRAGRPGIHLYGIDITAGGRQSGPWRAVDRALTYLALVDPTRAQAIRSTSTARLPRSDGPAFGPLSAGAQRDLESSIDALRKALMKNRATLIARSSGSDYRWAVHDIAVARQLARCLPVTPGGQVKASAWIPAVLCRDGAMAENVKWALDNEGSRGRLLVFGANEHVMSWSQDGRRLADASEKPAMMGAHLRRFYGEDLYVIASTFATASPELGTPIASERSLDRELAPLHQPHLFLDLRSARNDRDVLSRLSVPQGLGPNLAAEIRLTPATAFDALFFTERLTPATRASRMDGEKRP